VSFAERMSPIAARSRFVPQFCLSVQALLDFLDQFSACLTRIQRGKFIPEFPHGKLGPPMARKAFWVPGDLGTNGSAASRGGHASCNNTQLYSFHLV
jgi:hypothetical protein